MPPRKASRAKAAKPPRATAALRGQAPDMTAPKATAKAAKQANSLWGGRFDTGPAALMAQINASIDFDRRLYAQDIRASLAHAAMLAKQQIIPAKDGEAIAAGLGKILRRIESGDFTFSAALEDIHMNVEARLTEDIGEAGGRLHTARSRNDQVATDFRL